MWLRGWLGLGCVPEGVEGSGTAMCSTRVDKNALKTLKAPPGHGWTGGGAKGEEGLTLGSWGLLSQTLAISEPRSRVRLKTSMVQGKREPLHVPNPKSMLIPWLAQRPSPLSQSFQISLHRAVLTLASHAQSDVVFDVRRKNQSQSQPHQRFFVSTLCVVLMDCPSCLAFFPASHDGCGHRGCSGRTVPQYYV